MKKCAILLCLLTSISLTYSQHTLSGKLEIPNSLFSYSAIGKGIPCIAFTGAENLAKQMYPESFLERINLIQANPDNIPKEDVNNITLDDVIDDIERARKHLNIEKIAVMGHSMFGTLPLEYALKYPDNVLFTISTGSVPAFNENYNQAITEYWETFATDKRKEIFQSRMDSLMATDYNSLSASEQFIKRYIAGTPKTFFNPTFDCSGIWEGVVINTDFVYRYFGSILASTDNSEKYKTIDSPNLILSGKYDFACPHYLWDGIVEEIPNAKFVLYDNTGHNPMIEIPEEFTKDVLEWVQEIEAEKIKQIWYDMGEALIDKNWDEYQNFWVQDSTVNALHPSEPDWAKGWQALQKRYKAICESDFDMSDVSMPKADIFDVYIAPGGEFAWALIEQRMFRTEEQFYHSWYMLIYKKINGKWLVNAILDANVPPQITE